MKKVMKISCIVCLLFFTNRAHADLTLIGQGSSSHGTYNLIYDTDFDITWYDYTIDYNYWQNQMDWADALVVNFGGALIDDWRLPNTFDQSCSGYNCTNSEMGHLHYTELGNTAGAGGFTNMNYFQNLKNLHEGRYWSGTDYSVSPDNHAWAFNFWSGAQGNGDKITGDYFAVAVRDGLAVVPEPISSILFLTGGALMAGRRYLSDRTHGRNG